jgi:DNA-binding transcriptional MocR family regulator
LGNHIRLSYAFYDDADIAEGVARLGSALRGA